jgi:hypothetical protein
MIKLLNQIIKEKLNKIMLIDKIRFVQKFSILIHALIIKVEIQNIQSLLKIV